MPVTFRIAEHPAIPFIISRHAKFNRDQSSILWRTNTAYVPKRILQSSVDGSQNVLSQRNGFVQGTLLAYNKHHNLIIRPDDVWIAILSQLNYYINAHANELRDKFTSHAERKELVITSLSHTIEGMDFGQLSLQLSSVINGDVRDPSFVPWVLPNFTTTTPDDSVICCVLLMSTLKEYFSYQMGTFCGIPNITLDGTQEDWQSILDRIDRLAEFGTEPTQWAGMLRAILVRFVRAFDDGGPEADKEFWKRMVHEDSASGTYWIGGWMSAFCAWDSKGVFFSDMGKDIPGDHTFLPQPLPDWVRCLEVDGYQFPRVQGCPEGFAEVDIQVKNGYETWDCRMLAGHIGISLDGDNLDTIRMAPQWFIYVKGEVGEARRFYTEG